VHGCVISNSSAVDVCEYYTKDRYDWWRDGSCTVFAQL
jgi:hypothetical protein